MQITSDYHAHRDLVRQLIDGKDNYGTPIKYDEAHYTPKELIDCGHTMIAVEEYCAGDREVDSLAIVGFYTHDGNVTVAVNHTDGLQTLDDADLMFPTNKED